MFVWIGATRWIRWRWVRRVRLYADRLRAPQPLSTAEGDRSLSWSEDGRTIAARKRRWKGRPHVRGNRGTASGPKCTTARRSRRRAGRTRGGRVLTAERIDARAILAFGGIDSQAHLLAERAGKEAAHTMGLPTGGSHQFRKCRSTLTAEQRQNVGLLAALAGRGRLLLRAGPLGRFGSLRPHTGRLCASIRCQVLNGSPDSDHSRFPARESFRRDNARQSVPDIHQPRGRPLLG